MGKKLVVEESDLLDIITVLDDPYEDEAVLAFKSREMLNDVIAGSPEYYETDTII